MSRFFVMLNMAISLFLHTAQIYQLKEQHSQATLNFLRAAKRAATCPAAPRYIFCGPFVDDLILWHFPVLQRQD